MSMLAGSARPRSSTTYWVQTIPPTDQHWRGGCIVWVSESAHSSGKLSQSDQLLRAETSPANGRASPDMLRLGQRTIQDRFCAPASPGRSARPIVLAREINTNRCQDACGITRQPNRRARVSKMPPTYSVPKISLLYWASHSGRKMSKLGRRSSV